MRRRVGDELPLSLDFALPYPLPQTSSVLGAISGALMLA
jgi:hypothetical protein